MSFHNFQDILTYLDKLGLFHIDLGLDRVRQCLQALGLDHPPFPVVQVLGTNGKGSTSTFIASLCTAHGLKCGLYTSPHFVSPVERIAIDGQFSNGEDWVPLANRILVCNSQLTYFEFLTVLAMLFFAEKKVDVAVFEAGLGGRSDATTAIPAAMRCYAPIALDHVDILGPTVRDIAADKADAIVSSAPVFSVPQPQEASAELSRVAQLKQAPLHWVTPMTEPQFLARGYALGLLGSHQFLNASLALSAWQHLADSLCMAENDEKALARGLATAFQPGRFQQACCTQCSFLLLDGAHNPHGMSSLISAMRQLSIQPVALIYSCLADKDWQSSFLPLLRYAGDVPIWIPAIDNPRAADVGELVSFAKANGFRNAVAVTGSNAVGECLDRAGKLPSTTSAPVLVTGSLYLLSGVYANHRQLLHPQRQGA